MIDIIKKYIDEDRKSNYRISIGTDSQNTNLTKIVIVISIYRVGKGGIFFYDVRNESIIKNIKQKIYYETSLSLDFASKISECFKNNEISQDIEIHVDIGTNRSGGTYDLVQSIIGWVNSAGYECKIKPYSYTASAIANRISK